MISLPPRRLRRPRRHHSIDVRVGVEGFVTVELLDAATQRVKRRLAFRNLVVNAGINGSLAGTIATMSTFLQNGYMGVGTSGVAPTEADTALLAQVDGRVNADGGITTEFGWGAANEYAYQRVTRLFTEAQSNGTLAEFGMFSASSGGTMLARQLFKDAIGNPTTITKTSSDQLRITYEFRVYPPADVVGTITLDGVVYDYTLRPLGLGGGSTSAWAYVMTNWFTGATVSASAYESNTLQAATATSPTGTGTASSSNSLSAYTTDSKLRDREHVWEPSVANFATGIGAVAFGNATGQRWLFQLVFTPTKVAKTSTKRLRLTIRWGWAQRP